MQNWPVPARTLSTSSCASCSERFGQRAGKEDDGVDAGHLQVDGFTCVLGGTFEMKACVAAASETDGAYAGIADELETVFVADVVDHLDRGEG